MGSDKYEVIYCPEDDENRVYCNICDKLCYSKKMIKVFTQNIPLIMSISMNSIKYSTIISPIIIKNLIFILLIVYLKYNLIISSQQL